MARQMKLRIAQHSFYNGADSIDGDFRGKQ
jgi:hypothetical protein